MSTYNIMNNVQGCSQGFVRTVDAAALAKQLQVLAKMLGADNHTDALRMLKDESTAYPQRLLLGPPAPIATEAVGYNEVDLAAYQGLLGAYNSHMGQLKLFYTLLEFLLLCASRGVELGDCLVVYIGAAPGTNILSAAELFPEATFLLYDPAPFDSRLAAASASALNIHIRTRHEGMFSLDSCTEIEALQKRLKKRHLLFISDIRLELTEEDVLRDMLLQQSAVLTLRPLAYQLKFRLPYFGAAISETTLSQLTAAYSMDKYKTLLRLPKGVSQMQMQVQGHEGTGTQTVSRLWYLGGDVYTQLYPPVRSTETRLVGFRTTLDGRVTPAGRYAVVQYDVRTYENVLNAFNLAVRPLKQYPSVPLVSEFLADAPWKGWQPSYEAVCELYLWDTYHTQRDPAHAALPTKERAAKVRMSMLKMQDIMGISLEKRENCRQVTMERHAQKHAQRKKQNRFQGLRRQGAQHSVN